MADLRVIPKKEIVPDAAIVDFLESLLAKAKSGALQNLAVAYDENGLMDWWHAVADDMEPNYFRALHAIALDILTAEDE